MTNHIFQQDDPSDPDSIAGLASKPGKVFVRRRLSKNSITHVLLPSKWRAQAEYFSAIPEGRLGFSATVYQDVQLHSRELLPKIYTIEGQELAPSGPVSVSPIQGYAKNRIRLVLVSVYNSKRERISHALAWQGDNALHLLTEMVQDQVSCDETLSCIEDINEANDTYIKSWYAQEQTMDWILDCEIDI